MWDYADGHNVGYQGSERRWAQWLAVVVMSATFALFVHKLGVGQSKVNPAFVEARNTQPLAAYAEVLAHASSVRNE